MAKGNTKKTLSETKPSHHQVTGSNRKQLEKDKVKSGNGSPAGQLLINILFYRLYSSLEKSSNATFYHRFSEAEPETDQAEKPD